MPNQKIRSKLFLFTLLILLLGNSIGYTQKNKKIDSLFAVVSTGKAADKVFAYNKLAELFRKINIDSSLLFAQKALDLATNFSDKKGMGEAYNSIGTVNYFKGDYSQAIDFYQKSFFCRQQVNDSTGMANSLNNIGVNYRKMDDFDKALQYYLQSLELKEKIGNKSDIISSLNNIGGVYYYQRSYSKALEYYNRSLNIAIEIKDSAIIAASYNNLSLIFDEKREFAPALQMANYSLSIRQSMNDQRNVAVSLNNIGRIYEHKNELDKAFDFYKEAVKVYEKIGDTPNLANTFYNIGNLYLTQKDNKNAMAYFEKSLAMSKDIDNKLQVRDIYRGLASANHFISNNDKAYGYLMKYIDLNDSIYDQESLNKMSEMEVKYQSEKKRRDIEILKHENELQELKQEDADKKQKLITGIFIGGIVIILFFGVLLYNRYQIKQKANIKLEAYNREVLLQKELVDEKNKEITDSIHYAQRIQQAILPSKDEFESLLPGAFVLFKPKDIVSGDFYWVTQKGDDVFFAAVDCTGHGVPGGFMSMLGNSLLNEVVNEKGTSEPAAILDVLRTQIILALKQKGIRGENKDGMDMAICRYNKEKNELVYAGANNPMYLVREGQLQGFKPVKQPIGIYWGETRPFEQQKVQLQKGDCIYIFTDGYVDQFGGPKGKKFRGKQLEELFIANAPLKIEEQKIALENAFEDWRGNFAQVDDVCVIGLKV